MKDDFKRAWDLFFEERRSSMPKEQAEAHEQFALTNRDRAQEFIKYLRSVLQYDFAGKRVLDVGSAYGGFIIESAKLGAEAYGIEIDKDLFDLGLANILNEEGKIKLVHGDVFEQKVLEATDGLPFDLIILNDVFEHIYDSVGLFERIRDFSGQNTMVYFSIPNGFSYGAVEREGHFFRFGLSLLEPADWTSVVGGFNVYYRPLLSYQLKFKAIGYPYIYLMVDEDLVGKAPAEIQKRFDMLEQKIHSGPFDTPALNRKVKDRFSIVKQRLQRDLKESDPLTLHLKYEQYVWAGLATRTAHPVLDRSPGLVRLSNGSNGSAAGTTSDIKEFNPAEAVIHETCIDISEAQLEAQDENTAEARVGVYPSQAKFRFGLRLNNDNDPREGDFTIFRMPIPAQAESHYILSLFVHNLYENEELTGRVDWSLFVNDVLLHTEDIALSSQRRHFAAVVKNPPQMVEVKLMLRALRDCEPWHWGFASKTFIEFVTLQRIDTILE